MELDRLPFKLPRARPGVNSRRVTRDEYEQVVDAALDLGFEELYTQEVDDRALNPDFDQEEPFAWEGTEKANGG